MLKEFAGNRKPLRGNAQEIPLYIPGKHKPVAGVTGHVLHKYIKGSTHFRRNPPSIGWDADLFRRAQQMGITELLAVDRETGTRYTVSLARFLRHSYSQDFGYGRQLFLSLDHWRKDGMPSPAEVREATLAQKAAIDAARPMQQNLFGGSQ